MLYSNIPSSSSNAFMTAPSPYAPEPLLQPVQNQVNVKATVEVVDKPPARVEVASTPPPAKQQNPPEKVLSPVDLLKAMFARNEYGNVVLSSSPDGLSFTRPSKEATDAYDLTVVQAIRHNDVESLRSMLRDGKSFNACNRFGESLVHMVCRRGNVEMATFLIKEACVDVDVRDDFGRTPMHDACWTSKPNTTIMELLVNNVSPDMLLMEDVRGHTPWEYCRKEHYGVWCDYLKSKEEDIQRRISTFGMIRG
ncbi:ANK [Seminavis robusta]|uniref:ANK n=1 Tax=Seminavis robusta TaxID=568900 RepID=A0A9N8E271_9STRA|nr:ANK [Seminavis robusta]|eukprot:Sro470_g149490.1 ANK (252) ;mRNA; f:26107-26862